jgi:hypothetical protein
MIRNRVATSIGIAWHFPSESGGEISGIGNRTGFLQMKFSHLMLLIQIRYIWRRRIYKQNNGLTDNKCSVSFAE